MSRRHAKRNTRQNNGGGFVPKGHKPTRKDKSKKEVKVMHQGKDYWGGTGTGVGYYGQGAKTENLAPHNPDTKIVFVGGSLLNKIKVTPLALAKMNDYIHLCPEEIGWLGLVTVNATEYVITDVILFKQEVTAATTEIDENSLAEIVNEILVNNPGVAGLNIVNSLRMWGHSHVYMGVTPSGQDDAQMNVFNTNGVDYFIRAIGNKSGKLRFDIYYYEKGVAYMDVEWSVQSQIDTEMRANIKAEIEEKVKKRVYTSTGTNAWGGNSYMEWLKDDKTSTKKSNYPANTADVSGGDIDPTYFINQLQLQREARRRLIAMTNKTPTPDEINYPADY